MFNLFGSFSEKIAAFLGERDFMGHNGADRAAPTSPSFNFTSLHQLLPYQSYCPQREIFYNKSSQGLLLEAVPLLGANEETINILASLLVDALPAGADCQFILWASPKIGDTLSRFENMKHEGGIIRWLAKKRVEHLQQGALNSLSTSGHFILRDFRLFVSLSLPAKNGRDHADTLCTLRSAFISSFKSIQVPVKPVSADGFVRFMADVLSPSRDVFPSQQKWCPYTALSEQLMRHGQLLCVFRDKLQFEGEDGTWEARCLSVKEGPPSMAQWDMANAIGKTFNSALQVPCPFLISFSIRQVDREQAGVGAQFQSVFKKRSAQSKNAEWLPKVFKEHQDWDFVTRRLSEGDKLVKTHFQITLFDDEKNAAASERKVHDLYRANGWRLKKTPCLQLPLFLSALPMMMSEGAYDDLKLLGRLKTMTAFNAANFAPLQGEWKGTVSPFLVLPGRRGQIATFSPFDNQEGNFNMAIAAASGKGKSVFLQDYIVSMVGNGGRVWAIDIGRSYEKTCKLLDGTFIEFTEHTHVALGPFALVTDFNASAPMLKPLLGAMARPTGQATDEEAAYLEKAAKAAWEEKGNSATITTVAHWLQQHKSPVANNLSHLLYSFTKEGVYAKYFEGGGSMAPDGHFVVLELQGLKNKPDLQRIVFLALVYQISGAMYLGERSTQKSCIIDEAWDLLGGDDLGAAKFIAEGFRNARKHNANFVTSMQSINDYFLNVATLSCYENSDIKIILGQTDEAIEQLKRSGRLTMDDYTERLFKSLRKTDDYSECIIKTPSGLSLHRIVLDPFARILYSSKGEEFEAVKLLEKQGMNLKEAVETVVARKYQRV